MRKLAGRMADYSDMARGIKRSTQVSIAAGIVVFLSLVSGASFAAWTASSSKSATATAGAISLTTSTSGGSPTITALGPVTYTSTSQSVTRPITVRNTGNVDAALSSIDISGSGTLVGAQISVRFWAGSSTACTASTPAVTTTLASGTVALAALNSTVPGSGSSILCTSTTFMGSMANDAGKSITATFAIKAKAGDNWSATDASSNASRSFTQQVFQDTAPNAPGSIQCVDDSDRNQITVSWSTPSGFSTPNGGYNVYRDGQYLGNTAGTSTLVANRGNTGTDAILTYDGNNGNDGNTGNLTVRAVTSGGTESVDSAPVPLQPRNGQSGLSCAS